MIIEYCEKCGEAIRIYMGLSSDDIKEKRKKECDRRHSAFCSGMIKMLEIEITGAGKKKEKGD